MNNIELLRQKTKLLQSFLEETQKIGEKLDEAENLGEMDSITQAVGRRDGLISEINKINGQLSRVTEMDSAYKSELDDNTWLWLNLLKEIEGLEKQNAAIMEDMKSGYEKKVQSAKNSIKVIDAYSKQMVEEDGFSIDKRK